MCSHIFGIIKNQLISTKHLKKLRSILIYIQFLVNNLRGFHTYRIILVLFYRNICLLKRQIIEKCESRINDEVSIFKYECLWNMIFLCLFYSLRWRFWTLRLNHKVSFYKSIDNFQKILFQYYGLLLTYYYELFFFQQN